MRSNGLESPFGNGLSKMKTLEQKRIESRARYKKWYEANKDHARKLKRRNMRKYRKENPEKYRKQSRKAKEKIRKKMFEMYGDKCVLCGFQDKRALTLDHINNNGAEERKKIGMRGPYYRAIKEYLPDEYRILCMNCRFIERIKNKRQNQH